MKLLVLILNKTEVLDCLLEDLTSAGVSGATIIESSGMAMTLAKLDSSFISNSLRSLFSSADEDNRTILMIVREEQIPIIQKVIYHSVGDLSQPNTGVMFAVPIDFVDGLRKNYGD